MANPILLKQKKVTIFFTALACVLIYSVRRSNEIQNIQSLKDKGGNEKHQESYRLALDESFGFFDDITDKQWERKKKWLHQMKHFQEATAIEKIGKPHVKGVNTPQWKYTYSWNPDFACPFTASVGPVGDGHKWLCDPHRLQTMDDCLVYSVGSHGMFGFEEGLLEIAPNCEIHIFDPDDYTNSMKEHHVKATFHAWGLTSTKAFTETLKGTEEGERDAIQYKDIHEIMRLLGHQNRPIHIFKIDCEGCEWDTYKDWMSLDIRQVQVETHQWKAGTMAFFEDLRKSGFALFSKEANTLVEGLCMEFSFLKLKPSFFLN